MISCNSSAFCLTVTFSCNLHIGLRQSACYCKLLQIFIKLFIISVNGNRENVIEIQSKHPKDRLCIYNKPVIGDVYIKDAFCCCFDKVFDFFRSQFNSVLHIIHLPFLWNHITVQPCVSCLPDTDASRKMYAVHRTPYQTFFSSYDLTVTIVRRQLHRNLVNFLLFCDDYTLFPFFVKSLFLPPKKTNLRKFCHPHKYNFLIKLFFVYSVYYWQIRRFLTNATYSSMMEFYHIILEAKRKHLLLQATIIPLLYCYCRMEKLKQILILLFLLRISNGPLHSCIFHSDT